jgi:hypothetical protein
MGTSIAIVVAGLLQVVTVITILIIARWFIVLGRRVETSSIGEVQTEMRFGRFSLAVRTSSQMIPKYDSTRNSCPSCEVAEGGGGTTHASILPSRSN